MATGGTFTATTEAQEIFAADSDGGGCTAFRVTNTGDTNSLLVQVRGGVNHEANEEAVLRPGDSEVFFSGQNGITSVAVTAAASTTTGLGHIVGRH